MEINVSNSERVYRYVRAKLYTGQLVQGDKISDVELANEVGISRTPVREAIIRLTNDGFCKQIPRLGTFVRVLSEKEIGDLFEVRVFLEVLSVMRAAIRRRKDDLEHLQTLCNDMREGVHGFRDCKDDRSRTEELKRRYAITDMKFHLSIVRISGNLQILKIFSDLQILTRLCRNFHEYPVPEIEDEPLLRSFARSLARHTRIYRAIRSGDPVRAKQAILAHLTPPDLVSGRSRLTKAYQKLQADASELPVEVLMNWESSAVETFFDENWLGLQDLRGVSMAAKSKGEVS